MAELATIARPYAEALFQASHADADAVLAWLEPLAAAAAQPDVLAFAQRPSGTAAQTVEALSAAFKGALDAKAINFLTTMVENRRLAALPEVARQFRALRNARLGTQDAQVWSAFALDQAALDALRPALEKRFARQLNLSVHVDPQLIGGVRVVVGDEVYDASVRSRLEHMRVSLAA
jgi:F-type H+-transporting ATPase subunit delta